MQCIRYLRESEYDHLRWAQIMKQQCHNQNINLDEQPEYLVAERPSNFRWLFLIRTYFKRCSNEISLFEKRYNGGAAPKRPK